MNFYVGTSGYGTLLEGAVLSLKVAETGDVEFLRTRFSSVEINSSFYRPPSASVLEEWASQVPADFRFVSRRPEDHPYNPSRTSTNR